MLAPGQLMLELILRRPAPSRQQDVWGADV
jgi:hypothetical protein